MRHNKTLLLIFFILLSLNALAQINLRPGYIVTNTNDIIHGYIDFRTDMRNAHQCTFKDPETNITTTYQPGEIYAYRFTDDGKYYVTRTVTIDNTPRTLFLEYIIQGIISLYYYPGDKTYFFFEMENGNMVEISKQDHKEITTEGGKTGYVRDIRYVGILKYIFSKSRQVEKKVSESSFDKFTLQNLTKQYHYDVCETGQECITFESLKDKKYIKLSYTLSAGAKFHNFSFGEIYYLRTMNPLKSFSPSVGLELGLAIPRWSRIVGANISVDISKLAGERDQLPTAGSYYKLKVEAIVIDNQIGIRFNPFNSKVRPYIEGGYYQTYLAGLSVDAFAQRYEGNAVKEHKVNYADDIPNFLMGFYGKVGIDIPLKKHKLSICGYHQQAKSDDTKLKTTGVSAGFTF